MRYVENDNAMQFIVVTESGILHRRSAPTKELIAAPPEGNCACNECPFMRLNTPEEGAASRCATSSPASEMPEETAAPREEASRMLELSCGAQQAAPAVQHASSAPKGGEGAQAPVLPPLCAAHFAFFRGSGRRPLLCFCSQARKQSLTPNGKQSDARSRRPSPNGKR
ncbi:MAG: hypothetical protein R3B07_27020 [Polyangiaceae bacterium]